MRGVRRNAACGPPGLVHHFLENSAARFPDKIALVHGAERVAYAEINRQANRVAGWLLGQGVAVGDRVVILLENSLAYVVAYYAVLKAGGVAVPLGTDSKAAGLSLQLVSLSPRIVISSFRFETLLKDVVAEAAAAGAGHFLLQQPRRDWTGAGVKVTAWDDVVSGGEDAPPDDAAILLARALRPADPASIIFTSGSSGRPKGVILTHRNLVSNVAAICQSLRLEEKDVQMVVLPFFYVMGKSLLNTHFAVGGRVVINNRFAFPAAVCKEMELEKVTGFSGVPSTFTHLLHRSPLLKYKDRWPFLRYCSQAGGHLPRSVKLALRQALPEHTDLYIMYGATEAAARPTCLPPEKFAEKIDSVGRPLPGVRIEVVDEKGRPLAPGREGELIAWGDNISAAYWQDAELSAEKFFAGGGYRSGDFGYCDGDGFFYLVGRRDGLVKVGGHRVSLLEVEEHLAATGLLVECAVLSEPDELLGNRLVAMVVPMGGEVDEHQLRSVLSSNLPAFKIPAIFQFMPALPKNASGKIVFV